MAKVRTVDDSLVKIKSNSLCIHGDQPHAAGFTDDIRKTLKQAETEIEAL